MRLSTPFTRLLFVVVLTCTIPPIAHAQDGHDDSLEVDYEPQLPRIAPHEPKDVAETFVIHPDFELELVAAEPLVHDPIAMAFDEKGRMFVVEMRGYSERRDENIGAIRLLTDTDGDGVYDKSDIYADGLAWPTSVACYDGGVYVGLPPDIYYFKDTDGDNQADIKEHVYTGFGLGNVQGLLNTFKWGLDNRIHGATSSSGGTIQRVDIADSKPVAVGGRDFSFDPATRDLKAVSGGGQHGLTFDLDGHKLICNNSDHIMMVMYEDRYVARNPYLAAPRARMSIALDGAQADVFRQSPVEPWRIVRTRLRVKGIVPGPVEGGGTASGYFTSATGITVYKGDAWPEEYRGQVFVADVGSNLIHRKNVSPNGVAFEASRIDKGKEFIASTDNWFRPVQFVNGPDGTLYVADMYRETIEHPASLAPLIKKHLDLNSGFDRGRIYRIVPKGFKQPKIPNIAKYSDGELAETLAHRNAWHHETAARMIAQRSNADTVPIQQQALNSTSPQGRMRALNNLASLGTLDAITVGQSLNDESPIVREHALRLAESLLASSPELQAKVITLVNDPDARVRYQLAYTLGEHPTAQDPPTALIQLAIQDAGDSWVRLALLSSLTNGAGEVLTALVKDSDFGSERKECDFLAQLALQVGATGQSDDLKLVMGMIENLPASNRSIAQLLVKGVINGLRRSPGNTEAQAILAKSKTASTIINSMIANATALALDTAKPQKDRAEAIQTLSLAPYKFVKKTLLGQLQASGTKTVQLATLKTLRNYDDKIIAKEVLEAWPMFTSNVRDEALELLFSRQVWTTTLLNALEADDFAKSNITSTRIQYLTNHKNPTISKKANALFTKPSPDYLETIIKDHQAALTLKANPKDGRATFEERCAQCHRFQGIGFQLGPDLSSIAARGAETILVNIIDPNREINPQYVNFTVEMKDGNFLTGILDSETSTSVTLKRAGGLEDTLLRVNILDMFSSDLSIMPENLQDGLGAQGMADLIAFLLSED